MPAEDPVADDRRTTVEAEPADGAVLRLVIAYDGSGFHGMAANDGVRTVAGDLGAALARVLGRPVDLGMAGRTDAGVHAWGQVVSVPGLRAGDPDRAGAARPIDLGRLRHSLNRLLAPEIVVRAATWREPGFDARHSATARRYRYTVLNRDVPDPFLARTAWWVGAPLELAALRAAADPLLGEHDFTSFCRRIKGADPERPPSMSRRVVEARWDDQGDGVLAFWITANAFCHQMVRSIVGTLVDVGAGRRRAADVTAVLRARDRAAAGPVAPPHGLCLWQVSDGPEPAELPGSDPCP